jgi:UDP-GlcNAc:undecaprenyl-phosphate GlcNAc-1-phosphate transferase
MPTFTLPIREYALVFGAAMLVTFVLTGVVRGFAVKVRALTPIRVRDIHRTPTPRLGGIGVYLGVTVALLLASQLPQLNQAFAASSQLLGVVVAGGVICVVGALDDRFDLDAVTKLAAQVLAAAILVFFGVQWIVMWLPTGAGLHGTTVTLDQAQSTLATVMITLVLMNAMNFIDGLDGLLAGVAAISGIGMFVFSAHVLEVSANDSAASQAPLIAVALVGACLGFLPHNFHHARIFMGDAGSMFIGMAMAAGIVEVGGTISPSTYGARTTVAALAPLVVALAVVFIPALDLLLAVVRRTKERRHPFSADQRHLHHRMLAVGHSHRGAVLVFYLWAAVISGGAVALAFTEWTNVVGPAAGGLVLAIAATFWPKVRRRIRAQRRLAAAADAAVDAATGAAAAIGPEPSAAPPSTAPSAAASSPTPGLVESASPASPATLRPVAATAATLEGIEPPPTRNDR